MSDIIGVRNNNTIVPYTAATKRTKQLDIKANITYDIASATTGWTFTAAYAIFYADSSGNWRMRFNVRLLKDSGTATTTLATLTFTNITNFQMTQTIAGSVGSVVATISNAVGSSKNVTVAIPSTAIDIVYVSGDVMLSAEPTAYTTAANMEGVLPVDVYIPNATATPGLLSYYEEYTSASAACTGALTTSVSWKIVRIGKLVTLTLPQTLGAGVATSSFVYGVAVPPRFLPAQNTAAIVELKNNAARQSTPGMVIVETNGAIAVYNSLTGGTNFTVTAECGLIEAHSISWVQ
jgi:hypothetical protein